MDETRAFRAWPRVLVHVVIPSILGLLAYVAWRPTSVPVTSWMPPRDALEPLPFLLDVVPSAWRGPWPDACWAYAVCAAVALAWRGQWDAPAARAWRVAAWVLVPGAELLQAMRVVPGTFDAWDLLAAAVAGAVALRVASAPGIHHPGSPAP